MPLKTAQILWWAGIVIFAIVVWIINAHTLGAWSWCEGPASKSDLFSREANSCLEFWLNRYQTLLVGIPALAAAIFAGIAAAGQMREAKRQSAIALQPVVEGRIGQLDREISPERLDLLEAIQREMQSDLATVFGRGMARKAEDLAKDLASLLNRQPGGTALHHARLELRDCLYQASMFIKQASEAESRLSLDEVSQLASEELVEREQKHKSAIDAMRRSGELLQIGILRWKQAVRDEQKKLFERLVILGDQATS
jgi:hypothetical protein